MSREMRIQIVLRISPRTLIAGLGGLFLLGFAAELGSESVTLTTYYPAPSGVYTQMITTDNTYLARDAGRVGVGTITPLSKMDVSGGVAVGSYAGANAAPSNGLIVSGSLGLGAASPLSKMDVSGGVAVGSYAGANAAPSNGLIVSGSLGVGTFNPSVPLDVSGDARIVGNATLSGGGGRRGYLYVNNSNTGCGLTGIGAGNTSGICSGGYYASWTPGIWVEGWSYQNLGEKPYPSNVGTIQCCPK